MPSEVSKVVIRPTTPKRDNTHFQDRTLEWFQYGEDLEENAPAGEYLEPLSARLPILYHCALLAIGLSGGLLTAWLLA